VATNLKLFLRIDLANKLHYLLIIISIIPDHTVS